MDHRPRLRPVVARYLAVYRRHRAVDAAAVRDREVVHAAARLSEPVPEEHPALHRLVADRLA